MNIRTAILRAADSIEQNPHLFMFMSARSPSHSCGTPGCAIGWISYHAKVEMTYDNAGNFKHVVEMMGAHEGDFYDKMYDVSKGHDWKHSGGACAKALREYADRYHPEERHPSMVAGKFDSHIWNPLEKV